jgi:hypothetical protein
MSLFLWTCARGGRIRAAYSNIEHWAPDADEAVWTRKWIGQIALHMGPGGRVYEPRRIGWTTKVFSWINMFHTAYILCCNNLPQQRGSPPLTRLQPKPVGHPEYDEAMAQAFGMPACG